MPKILSSKIFGEFSRYRLDEFRTRFGYIVWIVSDAEKIDPFTGFPSIIREADNPQSAMAGLQ